MGIDQRDFEGNRCIDLYKYQGITFQLKNGEAGQTSGSHWKYWLLKGDNQVIKTRSIDKMGDKADARLTIIERVQELMMQLTQKQIRKHEKQLKMVAYKINYTLLKGDVKEDVVIEQAKKVVEEINKLLNKKVNQLH